MDEDWKNAFGILICTEICDGAGAGICDGTPSTALVHYAPYFEKVEEAFCFSFIHLLLILFGRSPN